MLENHYCMYFDKFLILLWVVWGLLLHFDQMQKSASLTGVLKLEQIWEIIAYKALFYTQGTRTV